MEGWDLAKVAAVCGLMQLFFAFLLRPAVLWGLDQRYAPRGTSASTKDVDGLGGKVVALEGLFVRADDRWGEVESRVQALEIKSQHEWKRISEQMAQTAKTLEKATDKLSSISHDHVQIMTELKVLKPGGGG
jgi:hypothetical protein